MTFKDKMFSFEGRMGRQDFWVCTLILWGVRWSAIILFIVIAFGPLISASIASNGKELSDEQAMTAVLAMLAPMGILALLLMAMVWPEMAINVKRFHDRDQSGWLAAIFFINCIPVLNYLTLIPSFIFWVVDLGILEGTRGPNRYGQSPDAQFGEAQVFA